MRRAPRAHGAAPSPRVASRVASPSAGRGRIVFVLACVATCAHLGAVGLLNPDEGRYTEMAREMALTGDLLVPRIGGVPHWAKPPGHTWAAAAAYRVFGMERFAGRLPSALAGCVTLAALYLLTRRLATPRAGLLAVAILAATGEPFVLFRAADPNALLTACTTVAVAAFVVVRDVDGRFRPWAFFGGWLALGVGWLVKGPIALLICAATFGAWALVDRSWRRAAPSRVARALGLGVAGLAVSLAVGLPWFLAVSARHPDLASFYLHDEVSQRYFSDAHGRGQPWWFFTVIFTLGLLPWTPLFAASCARAFRRGATPPEKFLLCWIVAPFVMFHVGRSKLWTYLLPIFPACAALIALRVESWAHNGLERGAKLALRATIWLALSPLAVGGALVAGKHGASIAPWAATLVVLGAALIAVRRGDAARGRADAPIRAVGTAAVAFLVAFHAALVIFDRQDDVMGDRGEARGLLSALETEGAAVRGVPLAPELRPGGRRTVLPSGVDRLVAYRTRMLTLSRTLLGERLEFIPCYDVGSWYEIASDRAADRPPDLGDLATELARPERTYVVTRAREIDELRARTGAPLPEVARVGKGRSALALLRNR